MSLRVVKPRKAAIEAQPQDAKIKDYLDRLVKLIPGEIVAAYPVGKQMADNDNLAIGIWSLICLGTVVLIRAYATNEAGKGPQWLAVAISAVSFVIWVYVIGGHFWEDILEIPQGGNKYSVWALLIWTIVVPIIYKGDE